MVKRGTFSKYNVLVYNKGINEDFYNPGNVVKLDNVGREGHSYLYHIVTHYDNLTDIIIFLPGSLNLPHKIEKGKRMVEKIDEDKKAVFITIHVNKDDLNEFIIN